MTDFTDKAQLDAVYIPEVVPRPTVQTETPRHSFEFRTFAFFR